MIDEFQDTSVKEWQNFLPLLHNAMAQSEQTSVLLVGDIKQSIYRWRGGDWKILHSGAVEALGADNVEVKPLEENWRSLRGIVNFNNLLIDRAVKIDSAALCGTLDEGVAKGAIAQPLAAQLGRTLAEAYASHTQRPCKQSRNEGYVRIETFAGDPPLIERIKETIDRGFRPKEIVVLVRGRNDGARVAEQLLDFKRRNDDPRYRFDIMTQEALVIGRAPVSGFVAAALRLAVEQQDSVRDGRSTRSCRRRRPISCARSACCRPKRLSRNWSCATGSTAGAAKRPICKPFTNRSSASRRGAWPTFRSSSTGGKSRGPHARSASTRANRRSRS